MRGLEHLDSVLLPNFPTILNDVYRVCDENKISVSKLDCSDKPRTKAKNEKRKGGN